MHHRPSPTLQTPSSRPLERWPASGEARVNLWAALIGGATRPPDAATPSQVDEAREPGSQESLRSPLLGQGTVCTHMQTRRLSRVIRAAIKTRLALSRSSCTVHPAAYPRSGVWTRAGSSSLARRLPLSAWDAGFPGRRRPGEHKASGEKRCSPG